MSKSTSKKSPSLPSRSELPTVEKSRFSLRVLRGEKPGSLFRLPAEGELTVGRTRGTLCFPTDASLSDPHALLAIRQGRLALRVLPTVGGVYRRLRGEAQIESGALFSVGCHHLRFVGKLPDVEEKIFGATHTKALYGVEELLSGGISGRRAVRPAPRLIIGSGGCDLAFSGDSSLQGRHCELSFEQKGTFLRDLGSVDGTFLRLMEEEEVLLEQGDTLRIGAQFLLIEVE